MLIDEHPQLRHLPRAQMLQLVDELYSLCLTGKPQPEDEDIYQQLRESLEEYHQAPKSGSIWDEVKARVLGRRDG